MSTPLDKGNNFMDFEELSKAFVDDSKDYVQVLKMINEDFINYHMQIMDAITESNIEAFGKIHHNLRGSIILFKIPGLTELMKKIEQHLKSSSSNNNSEIRDEVHQKFNLIFQSLEDKINELRD